MSSTNRSKSRELHIADYYITPQHEIHRFWEEFSRYEQFTSDIKILEPCAGGKIDSDEMSYVEVLKNFGFNNIDTIDIRDDSLAEIKGDYLKINCSQKYDLIISNPPFVISQEIITKALDDVKENGFVIMLLRLNYLEGKSRKEFWLNNMPKYIFVHSKRMSFTKDGKTDSIAYAHYVWQKGYKTEFSKIKVI